MGEQVHFKNSTTLYYRGFPNCTGTSQTLLKNKRMKARQSFSHIREAMGPNEHSYLSEGCKGFKNSPVSTFRKSLRPKNKRQPKKFFF